LDETTIFQNIIDTR